MPRLDLDLNTKLKLLVTGNPGIGKTTLCGTAMDDERTAPVLVLSFAGNPQVLASRPLERRPTVWNCKSLAEVGNILTWIKGGQAHGKLREEMELEGDVFFQTLCVDHLAEFQRLQYADIIGTPDAAFDIHSGKLSADEVASKKSYKIWQLMWLRSIALARVLSDPLWPTHVVLTVHIKAGEDGSGTIYEPMLWGASDYEVPGYVLAHGWLTWVKDMPKSVRDLSNGAERVLIFKDTMQHVTLKEQYTGRIPQYVFDPTIPLLVDYIGGKHAQTAKA